MKDVLNATAKASLVPHNLRWTSSWRVVAKVFSYSYCTPLHNRPWLIKASTKFIFAVQFVHLYKVGPRSEKLLRNWYLWFSLYTFTKSALAQKSFYEIDLCGSVCTPLHSRTQLRKVPTKLMFVVQFLHLYKADTSSEKLLRNRYLWFSLCTFTKSIPAQKISYEIYLGGSVSTPLQNRSHIIKSLVKAFRVSHMSTFFVV